MKECPKCGFVNEMGGDECPRCGIVYAKYQVGQKTKAQPAQRQTPNQEPPREKEAAQGKQDRPDRSGVDLKEIAILGLVSIAFWLTMGGASGPAGALVSVIIIASSIWVYFDAKAIGVEKGQIKGFTDLGRWGWFMACMLIWILGFPLYLSKRDTYKRINSQQQKATAKCAECGHEMAADAGICLNCGTAPAKRKTGALTYVIAGVLILFGIGLVAGLVEMDTGSGSSSYSYNEPVVTYSEYSRVQNGMSYDEVVSIIGERGREVSRGHTEGVPGVMEDLDTVMYDWVNNDGSNMSAMFQNDRLMNKAQFGLE